MRYWQLTTHALHAVNVTIHSQLEKCCCIPYKTNMQLPAVAQQHIKLARILHDTLLYTATEHQHTCFE